MEFELGAGLGYEVLDVGGVSVVGVRVILGVVVNGVMKVMTACSPAANGLSMVHRTGGYGDAASDIVAFYGVARAITCCGGA